MRIEVDPISMTANGFITGLGGVGAFFIFFMTYTLYAAIMVKMNTLPMKGYFFMSKRLVS